MAEQVYTVDSVKALKTVEELIKAHKAIRLPGGKASDYDAMAKHPTMTPWQRKS